jgi:hypothetical protein
VSTAEIVEYKSSPLFIPKLVIDFQARFTSAISDNMAIFNSERAIHNRSHGCHDEFEEGRQRASFYIVPPALDDWRESGVMMIENSQKWRYSVGVRQCSNLSFLFFLVSRTISTRLSNSIDV